LSPRADISPGGLIGRTLLPMSERLVIPSRTEAESELSVARPWWEFSVRFNVAVSQSVPVARMHERETEGVMMRWGLLPASAKGDLTRAGPALARSDSLQGADELRSAWLHGRRGIVPLAGFYLWQRTKAGHRQPYYVRLVNRPVFGVAVVWEHSVTDDDEVIESCALVTVAANPLLAEIDANMDQMPAILRREDYNTWMGATVTQANALLQTYPQTQMVTHPVGPYVNDLERDEPSLIQRLP
jgi:putative SOS response-associated peptidase YedK